MDQKEQEAREELYKVYGNSSKNMIEGMHSEGKTYQEIKQIFEDYGL